MTLSEQLFSRMPVVVICGSILSGVLAIYIGMDAAVTALQLLLILGTAPYVLRMLKDLLQKRPGIDIIALLAIIVSLMLGQYLAGVLILFMLSGGEALEEYALGRARRQLTELISKAPSIAHRQRGKTITDISVSEVVVGDVLVVKPGEIIPVDGTVTDGVSMVDESSLTGESLPVEKTRSSRLLSGSVNIDRVLEMSATKTSEQSNYSQIIALVREASEARAPIVRLADQASVWFTLVTLGLGGVAWYLSGDPLRVLAVLVVATPCPLIVATPVAVMSAVSWAAKRGIVVKNGGALETLARAKAFVFDKTGTLTLGTPKIVAVEGFGLSQDEVIRLAASLDQLSAHILARSLVTEAQQRKLTIEIPKAFREDLANGVAGTLGKDTFAFGKLSFLEKRGVVIPAEIQQAHESSRTKGQKDVYLARGNACVGSITFADVIRPDTAEVFAELHRHGVQEVVMLTGDKASIAQEIARQIGIDRVHAECLPVDKVEELRELQKRRSPVVMVGDGVNDAPALAAADVGIAMGAHGATAASESADIVITIDEIARAGEALHIAQRMLKIAMQSISFGIGMSILFMIAAALGAITPVTGAVLQEVLDVAVIMNALRVHADHRD